MFTRNYLRVLNTSWCVYTFTSRELINNIKDTQQTLFQFQFQTYQHRQQSTLVDLHKVCDKRMSSLSLDASKDSHKLDLIPHKQGHTQVTDQDHRLKMNPHSFDAQSQPQERSSPSPVSYANPFLRHNSHVQEVIQDNLVVS